MSKMIYEYPFKESISNTLNEVNRMKKEVEILYGLKEEPLLYELLSYLNKSIFHLEDAEYVINKIEEITIFSNNH